MCMEREDIVRSLLESKETDSENKLRNDEFIDEHVLQVETLLGLFMKLILLNPQGLHKGVKDRRF